MNERFIEMMSTLGIELSETQKNQFGIYYEQLIEWNKKMNLTSITDKEEVYIKHFYDSVCLVKGIQLDKQRILDVGSGAGFPSIPLKIVFPNLDITIIDSLNKRIKFLNVLCEKLEIDARLIHGRAEEHKYKNHYDLVTARAVANLRMLSELCIPFVKLEGYFVALKGPKHIEELELANNAIKVLGGTLEDVVTYEVEKQERSLVKIRKTSKTKKEYPRMFSKIKKNPL